MFTPRMRTEITKEWIESVISHFAKESNSDSNIKVQYFTTSSVTKEGDNFNSELVGLDVTVENSNGIQEYHWILKFEALDVFVKEFNRAGMNHIMEMKLFSIIHKDLQNFERETTGGRYPLCIPKYYFGLHDKEDYVIVMENLKNDDYIVNDKMNGLGYEELQLVLQQLAHWHAISYALDQKQGFNQTFKDLSKQKWVENFFGSIMLVGVSNVVALLEQQKILNNFCNKLKQREQILAAYQERLNDTCQCGIKCLVHGDMWNNNILLKYEDDRPKEISFVDWQMCGWKCPMIDLQYLINTSTTYEIRKKHLPELLSMYHSTFCKVVLDLGITTLSWSPENFKAEYRRFALSGLLYGISLCQGTLSQGKNKMNSSQTHSNPRSFATKCKSYIARKFVSLMQSPAVGSMLSPLFSKVLKPIKEEMLQGTNNVMNTRLIDLCEEADENGVLDFIKIQDK